MLVCCAAGCGVPGSGVRPDTVDGVLNIGDLIFRAYQAAQQENSLIRGTGPQQEDYIESLLGDGRLTIGLGIGTRDLGRVAVPEDPDVAVSRGEYSISGKKILVEGRLILSRTDFLKAIAECEVVFVTSHSRFGAGPVFLRDGLAHPFRMQQTNGYDIVMPETEVKGYQGTVKRRFTGPLGRKGYVVFHPSSSELNSAVPLHGYQMLVLSTCTSKKHFLDEIAELRKPFPTTAVFTTRACCMDTRFRIFMRLLSGIFQERPIEEIVAGMNEEYRNVAWEHVRRRIPPWKVINRLYTIGINTIP